MVSVLFLYFVVNKYKKPMLIIYIKALRWSFVQYHKTQLHNEIILQFWWIHFRYIFIKSVSIIKDVYCAWFMRPDNMFRLYTGAEYNYDLLKTYIGLVSNAVIFIINIKLWRQNHIYVKGQSQGWDYFSNIGRNVNDKKTMFENMWAKTQPIAYKMLMIVNLWQGIFTSNRNQ